jgi:elongation factor 1-beta
VFKAITSAPDATLTSVNRWYNHIKSYESEFNSLPGSSAAGEAFLGGASVPAPAKAEDEDDDEVDLFGSDDEVDEEAERIKAERVAAYNAKKAGKPKVAAKVRILPDVSSYFLCRLLPHVNNFCEQYVDIPLCYAFTVRRHP